MTYLIITGQEAVLYDPGIRYLSPYIDVQEGNSSTYSSNNNEQYILADVFSQISYQNHQPKNMILQYIQKYVLTQNTRHLVICTSFHLSYIQQVIIYNELVRISIGVSFIPIVNYIYKRIQNYFSSNIPIITIFIDSEQIFCYLNYMEIKYYHLEEQQNKISKLEAYQNDNSNLKRSYIVFNIYDDIWNQISQLQTKVIINICMAHYTDIQIGQDLNKYLLSQIKHHIVGTNYIYFHKEEFIKLIKENKMEQLLHPKQNIYSNGIIVQHKTEYYHNETINFTENGLYYSVYNPEQLNFLIFNQYDNIQEYQPQPIIVKAYLSMNHWQKDYKVVKNKKDYQKVFKNNIGDIQVVQLSGQQYSEIKNIIQYNHFGEYSPLNNTSQIGTHLFTYTKINDYLYGKYNEILIKNQGCLIVENIVIFPQIILQTDSYVAYYAIDTLNKQFISVLLFKKIKLNSVHYTVDASSNSYFLNYDEKIIGANPQSTLYNSSTSRSLMNQQLNQQIINFISSGIHINDVFIPLDVYLQVICQPQKDTRYKRVQLVQSIVRAIYKCQKRCFIFKSLKQILITANYKIKFDQFNSYPCQLQEQISSFQNLCYKYIFNKYLSYEDLIETSILPHDKYLIKNFVLFQPGHAVNVEYELVFTDNIKLKDNEKKCKSFNTEFLESENGTESYLDHQYRGISYNEEFGGQEERAVVKRLPTISESQEAETQTSSFTCNHSQDNVAEVQSHIPRLGSNIQLRDSDGLTTDQCTSIESYSENEDSFDSDDQDTVNSINKLIYNITSSNENNPQFIQKQQNAYQEKRVITRQLSLLDRRGDGKERKKAWCTQQYIDNTNIRYDSVCNYNRSLYWRHKVMTQNVKNELSLQLLLAAPLFLSDEQKALTIDQIEQSVNPICNFFQTYMQFKGLQRNRYQGIEIRTQSVDQSDINRAHSSSSCTITKVSASDIDTYVRKFRNILAHSKASIRVDDEEVRDGGALFQAFESKTPGFFEIVYDAWLNYIQYQ